MLVVLFMIAAVVPLVDPISILGYVLVDVFILNIPLLFSTVNFWLWLVVPIPTLPVEPTTRINSACAEPFQPWTTKLPWFVSFCVEIDVVPLFCWKNVFWFVPSTSCIVILAWPPEKPLICNLAWLSIDVPENPTCTLLLVVSMWRISLSATATISLFPFLMYTAPSAVLIAISPSAKSEDVGRFPATLDLFNWIVCAICMYS